MAVTASRPPGKVRIIGGEWRSRKLPVPDSQGLRPTPDRIRETLFNWLQNDIAGAKCLDLYAGSGVLGFEAVSRGASSATLVEQDQKTCRQLEDNVVLLKADNIRVINAEALAWLKNNRESYDLIFLDPPFSESLIEKSCRLIRDTGCLNAKGMIYIETSRKQPLPSFLDIKKQGTAGQVMYLLADLV